MPNVCYSGCHTIDCFKFIPDEIVREMHRLQVETLLKHIYQKYRNDKVRDLDKPPNQCLENALYLVPSMLPILILLCISKIGIFPSYSVICVLSVRLKSRLFVSYARLPRLAFSVRACKYAGIKCKNI